MELRRHKSDQMLNPALMAEIASQPFNLDYINENVEQPVLELVVDGQTFLAHETNNFNTLLENYFKSHRFIKVGHHLIHRPISFNMKKAFQKDGLSAVMHQTGHYYPELCDESKKIIQKMAKQREINNHRVLEAISQKAKIGRQTVILSDEEMPRSLLILSSYYQAILDTSAELGFADTINKTYLLDSGYPSIAAQQASR